MADDNLNKICASNLGKTRPPPEIIVFKDPMKLIKAKQLKERSKAVTKPITTKVEKHKPVTKKISRWKRMKRLKEDVLIFCKKGVPDPEREKRVMEGTPKTNSDFKRGAKSENLEARLQTGNKMTTKSNEMRGKGKSKRSRFRKRKFNDVRGMKYHIGKYRGGVVTLTESMIKMVKDGKD